MIEPLAVDVLSPDSVDDAVMTLKSVRNSVVIAGGTDLVARLKDDRDFARTVVDIGALPLNYVTGTISDGIRIGATTTAQDIARDPTLNQELPTLCQAARCLGGPQTQALATVGGNICNASPCANFSNVLLVLDATLVIRGDSGERAVPIAEFFKGVGRVDLGVDEILTEVRIPPIKHPFGLSYVKHVLRREMDIAVVGVAVLLEPDGGSIKRARIGLGSVGPRPVIAKNAQRALEGREFSDDVVAAAAKIAQEKDASYIDDVRASAAHRREITPHLVADIVKDAWRKGVQNRG